MTELLPQIESALDDARDFYLKNKQDPNAGTIKDAYNKVLDMNAIFLVALTALNDARVDIESQLKVTFNKYKDMQYVEITVGNEFIETINNFLDALETNIGNLQNKPEEKIYITELIGYMNSDFPTLQRAYENASVNLGVAFESLKSAVDNFKPVKTKTPKIITEPESAAEVAVAELQALQLQLTGQLEELIKQIEAEQSAGAGLQPLPIDELEQALKSGSSSAQGGSGYSEDTFGAHSANEANEGEVFVW